MNTANDKSQGPTTNADTWKIDPTASRVEFLARMRLMFLINVTVPGHFSDLTGTLTTDEHDPTRSQINVTIGAASLDTKMAARDKHLHAADFFDVEHYPTLTFTSQQIEVLDQAAGHYRVIGALTIREATHEVSLDAWNVSPETATDRTLTFKLTTVLNRQDWGLIWGRPIQRIADEINVTLNVQFVLTSSVGA